MFVQTKTKMTMIEYEKCVVGVSMVEQEIILLRNCLAGQVSFVQISHNVAFSILVRISE